MCHSEDKFPKLILKGDKEGSLSPTELFSPYYGRRPSVPSIFKHDAGDLKEMLNGCSPTQILYVPIDVAKANHSAMIVNFLVQVQGSYFVLVWISGLNRGVS